MKTIYIGLISLFAHIALLGQMPCNESMDSINVQTELNPEVNFIPFTGGQTPEPFDPPEAEVRDEYAKVITWVHGMNGTNASWMNASDYAEIHYNALPLRVDYSNFQATMSAVRIGVEDDIRFKWEALKDLTNEQGKRNSFAISHSLGGIAIRGASESYAYLEDKVNGIVTVTSPHGGSPLANYIDTEAGPGDQELVQDLVDFASRSCEAFGLGPILEFGANNTAAKWLSAIGFLDIENVLFGICNLVGENGVPLVVNNIAPMAVSELFSGSVALNIVERVPDAHKMLFATTIVDDPNAHHHAFKMFYSGQNNPSALGRFEAGSQTKAALDSLDSNRNWYNGKRLEWKSHYDNKPWYKANWQCFKTFGFGPCITYNDCKDISNGYSKGLNQFCIVNDFWEYIVGARSYEEPLGTCEYEDQYGNSWGEAVENVAESECNSGYWYAYPAQSTLTDYDGLITTESQTAWESCPEINKIIYSGSNHLQIKNDSNTKRLVDYTLRAVAGNFFGN